jgi:hypothetical protein
MTFNSLGGSTNSRRNSGRPRRLRAMSLRIHQLCTVADCVTFQQLLNKFLQFPYNISLAVLLANYGRTQRRELAATSRQEGLKSMRIRSNTACTFPQHPSMCFRRITTLALAALLWLPLAASAWTLDRNFNTGTLGQRVTSADGFDYAAGDSVYDNTHVYTGPLAARLTAREGETGWGKWGGALEHPTPLRAGDEIWFRVRTYFPSGFDYYSYSEGGRLKFLRIHTVDGHTKENQGYNDIYIDEKGSSTPFRYICECEHKWTPIGTQEYLPRFDRWETYEFYVKLHPVPVSQGGQAMIRFWKNGELMAEIRDRKTLKNMDSISQRTLLFTYWNGGAPKTQSMWVDDVVLTTRRPAAKDQYGNAFVGTGQESIAKLPEPPILEVH